MSSNFPIGVFDSGLGGLSVMCELVQQLPCEDILYFADSANCPYGSKSPEEVLHFSQTIAQFLIEKKCKLIVTACNTASAVAISTLRKEYPEIPFVAMEPAVKPAVQQTKTKNIGILATASTLKGELLRQTMERYAQGVTLQLVEGKGLAKLVEEGKENTQEAVDLLSTYLLPMMKNGMDTLVLGCTHYRFLRASIEKITQQKIAIIDPAPAVAKQTARLLQEMQLLHSEGHTPNYTFYTSGNVNLLQEMQEKLLRLKNVRYLNF